MEKSVRKRPEGKPAVIAATFIPATKYPIRNASAIEMKPALMGVKQLATIATSSAASETTAGPGTYGFQSAVKMLNS